MADDDLEKLAMSLMNRRPESPTCWTVDNSGYLVQVNVSSGEAARVMRYCDLDPATQEKMTNCMIESLLSASIACNNG